MVDLNEVVFSYTDKCNIQCDHCIVDSGPARTEKMDYEKAQAVIRDAGEMGTIKRITFTGGESLLFINEIGPLMSLTRSLGMNTALVSNGSWATSPEQAQKMLAKLEEHGLNELVISVSQWHSKFVPMERLDSIANGVKETSIRLTFYLCRLSDEDEVANSLVKKYTQLGVHIEEQYVVPYGRAAEKIENQSAMRFESINEMEPRRCYNVLGPMVVPEGDVYFCCSGDFYRNKKYSAHRHGNINEESFKSIAEKRNVRLVELIHFWGPKGIYEMAKDDLHKAGFVPQEKYFGDCGLCQQIHGDERWVKAVLQSSSKPENIQKLQATKLVDAHRNQQTPHESPHENTII